MYVLFWLFCFIVLFCVLYCCHRVLTKLQLTYISYIYESLLTSVITWPPRLLIMNHKHILVRTTGYGTHLTYEIGMLPRPIAGAVTYTTHNKTQQTNIHALSGIRTRNSRNRAAADRTATQHHVTSRCLRCSQTPALCDVAPLFSFAARNTAGTLCLLVSDSTDMGSAILEMTDGTCG